MIRRDRALEILKEHISDEIVVAVYQTLFDWIAINPRDLNYVATGAMGQASSHGLGLALANPAQQIIVFDGDGSLLMNLGSLVSVANAAPHNYHHFVFENGVYEVNGEHPIPGRDHIDFAGMAKAAGYKTVEQFSALSELKSGVESLLRAPGPTFAVIKIEPGESYPRDYVYIHSAEARQRFRHALRARSGQ